MISNLIPARLAITLVAALMVTLANAAERLPNLVIIITDDQGYRDVGFNGCTDFATPHLDRIASEGVRFTNGYVSCPVCGPSRAGLITGRYQDRFGFGRNPTIDPRNAKAGVPLDERNLAELLRPAGYRSMAVGKWHLGTHPTLRPLERGFDEFFGFLSGGHNYMPEQLTIEDLSHVKRPWAWYRTKLLRNEERVTIDEYLTDELSNAAVDFIRRTRNQPFFLYLAYNAPHKPLQATQNYLDRVKHIKDKRRRTYAAMITAVDDGVGRVLDELRRNGLDEHTLVVFLSDNGGPVGSNGNGSDNTPLRGGKGSEFEGGLRVPFAMRWTGVLPAGVTYEHPIISLDIAATILAATDGKARPHKPLDGVDLVPYLTGKTSDRPHDMLFWRRYGHWMAVRVADDKLIVPAPSTMLNSHQANPKPRKTMRFDLAIDITEKVNLAGREAAREAELLKQLERWNAELQPPAFPGLGSWKFNKKDQ